MNVCKSDCDVYESHSITMAFLFYYYYGYLVNEGINLILVTQTFFPSSLSLLYKCENYTLLAPISSHGFYASNMHFQHLAHLPAHLVNLLYSYTLDTPTNAQIWELYMRRGLGSIVSMALF